MDPGARERLGLWPSGSESSWKVIIQHCYTRIKDWISFSRIRTRSSMFFQKILQLLVLVIVQLRFNCQQHVLIQQKTNQMDGSWGDGHVTGKASVYSTDPIFFFYLTSTWTEKMLHSPKLLALLRVRLWEILAPKNDHFRRKSWPLFWKFLPFCLLGWRSGDNEHMRSNSTWWLRCSQVMHWPWWSSAQRYCPATRWKLQLLLASSVVLWTHEDLEFTDWMNRKH